MGGGFNIPWVVGSKYHKYGVRNAMGRLFKIPWVGGSIYHRQGDQNITENGFNIPYHKHFHIKDKKHSHIQGIPTNILLQVFIHV